MTSWFYQPVMQLLGQLLGQMMVIISNAENVKRAEWQDEDNLHISEMIIPEKSCTGSRMPVYPITEHFSSPWENA